MSGYIGNIPTPQATQTRDVFTATAGQTSFATSGYTPGFLDVYLNGVHLVNGTDYTASNGSDVVLSSGATAGDNLEVVAYTTFEVVDQSFSGNFSVDSPTFVVDAANNSVGIGTSSIASGVKMQVQSTGGTILSIKDTTSGSGDYSNIWFGDEDAEFVGFLGYNHGSDAMTFGTNSTERMRITATGSVGIGTSSPAVRLHVSGASVPVFVNSTDSNLYKLGFQDAGSVVGYIGAGSGAEFAVASNAGTERMRIDTSGRMYINRTTTVSGFASYINISHSGGSIYGIMLQNTSANQSNALSFINSSGSAIGSVVVNTTSTSYNTSSDYRLKENVVPLSGAADRLAQIPVRRFNFIADPDTTVDGFLAHEVQEFVPECVTGTKDQVETVEVTDEDGNVTTETRPVYQGIDQSKLVPLLTAALQEALGRIETLEAEVAALKGEPA